ncbi:thioesterase superfamily protein [Murinocardiopsis flavida]|uniref:Thioesterase superfamily protein n=1 Tax=Murinocardiopsis flavida TaxID=645275 RepID=A0A2P8CMW3_9ACTN|nr:thioesterase family protein [Murinocardiopsis flavida]PSK86287.1 thioesterase superfamily protein [Murinocardiopsis flavida]
MTRFDNATTVTPVGDGHYTAELDAGYLIGAAVNGGYLMAVMQRAVLAAVEHPHAVSSSFNFLRPCTAGPVEVDVEPLKAGRTVTTARVTLRSGGLPAVAGTIVAGRLEPGAVPAYAAEPPDIPALDDCRGFDPRAGKDAGMAFADRVDLLFGPRSYRMLAGTDEDPVPELLGHVAASAADGGPVADLPAFLPLAVDALPPVVSTLDAWSWAPTVELTWHLRALPEPGPLGFHARADLVGDGWFDETVDLYDTKGRLVAQSRQLARVGR